MNSKTIRSLKSLSTGMVLVAVVFAFLIAGIRIFGIQVFGVLTGSMEPSYPTGSLIYVKDVDAADLRVNDVITFSISPNVIATHRIVEIVPDENNPSIVRYRTKGDANNDVDASLVSAGNIIGKAMFAIPKLGYVASYIQQPPGIYVAIFVCGLMIAFVFYTDSLDNKQKQGKAVRKRPKAKRKNTGFIKVVNQLSMKLLGKPIIKQKNRAQAAASSFRQGYAPQRPKQQSEQQYGHPKQPSQQPYHGRQNQHPQQNYGQQGYGRPVNNAQQPYYQQSAPQGYYNPYQQPQSYTQQPYVTSPNQANGYVQQNGAAQQQQQRYGQQAYQPSYPPQAPYPPQPQQGYPYAPQGYQQPYATPPNRANGYVQQNGAAQQQQQRYGQQAYQPSYPPQAPYPPQQGYPHASQGYQQPYAAPPNQANGYVQQNGAAQQQQRRSRRTDQM